MTKAKILLFDKLPSSLPCPSNNYIKLHIDKINNSNYKSESTLGYILLSELLYKFCSVNIENVIIKENEYGKPEIISENNLHFNISHTCGAVCCAISDSSVGIDVEKIGEIREIITKKCFSENETAFIESPDDFYKLWTLKEAYLKATGTGINRPLTEIEFYDLDNCLFRDSGVVVSFKFYSTTVDGFALSIASENMISPSDLIVKHI